MGKAKSPRRVAENEALSVGTQIRGSAQKLNLVAGLIRGKKAEDALNILAFSKKSMARDASKVLASAIANAENNHNLDVDALSSPRPVSQEHQHEALHDSRPRPLEPDPSPFRDRVRIIVREPEA